MTALVARFDEEACLAVVEVASIALGPTIAVAAIDGMEAVVETAWEALVGEMVREVQRVGLVKPFRVAASRATKIWIKFQAAAAESSTTRLVLKN